MTDDYIGPAFLLIIALVGVWAVVNPAGIISWVKQAHPTISEDDPEARFYVNFIGAWFIGFAVLVFVVSIFARYR
jgi:hypothetical protein